MSELVRALKLNILQRLKSQPLTIDMIHQLMWAIPDETSATDKRALIDEALTSLGADGKIVTARPPGERARVFLVPEPPHAPFCHYIESQFCEVCQERLMTRHCMVGDVLTFVCGVCWETGHALGVIQ